MPVDAASVAAVDGARRSARQGGDPAAVGVLPLSEGYTFAALPATVERLLLGRDGGLPRAALGDAPERVERVVLVLLDAFGWRFFARHADSHPLLRRFVADGTVAKLTTQFPSTTAGHVTTIHTGRPVAEHGMYEWNIYEPSLDALVTPLMFSFAGDSERDTLRRAGADPRTVFPTATLYRRLAAEGVDCVAFHPASFAPSTYDGVLLDGATLHPYETLDGGFATLADALHAHAGPIYAYFYIDTVDATGHQYGPSSGAFDTEPLRTLYAMHLPLATLPDWTLLLLAADHGQVDVDPGCTRFVNQLWPEIGWYLRRDRRGRPLAPAGSARDLFLHTAAGAHAHVIDRLRGLLGDAAELRATDELVEEGLITALVPTMR